ncbi:MAG: CsgG/HfaB family protein [Pseudomonadota bacterium]
MTIRQFGFGLTVAASLALAGCQNSATPISQAPTTAETTVTHMELLDLPGPPQPVSVAVYGYFDETGQYKFSDSVQSLSRAVTQGGTSILIKALQDAGDGSWFSVVERARLDNLLKERQIIKETRALYSGGGDLSKNYLPPMQFAGVLLEGGIISYNSNTLSGGVGARYLGIGGSTEYRQDTVTVYLRAVSTNTGEVLKSVLARKTILSFGLNASVFKFVGFEELLEIEAGFTMNEPVHVALKQAIEKAVIAMVVEGADEGIWDFQDASAGDEIIAQYRAEKQAREFMSEKEFAELNEKNGGLEFEDGQASSDDASSAKLEQQSRLENK